jgi:hypothetical protein
MNTALEQDYCVYIWLGGEGSICITLRRPVIGLSLVFLTLAGGVENQFDAA